MQSSIKQLKGWIRSQHLICEGTDFVFETVDQTQLEKFEQCIVEIGGKVRQIKAVGNWPMGPNRSFKILRAIASVPRPGGENLVTYWAKRGAKQTRYSEINT
ncbi:MULTISPECIES: CpeR family transcriptional regulator [unclassified Synechococcus]|uniref:CpeR family transcriptional regulator n=1 Tax=unclassified Synechococcus TaxID=2626047 RepID=UPI0039AF9492